MHFYRTSALPDIIVAETDIHSDNRGRFFELYRTDRYESNGIPASFVQENVSISGKNVLRGLHYQLGHPQGKLVTVVSGEIFDVAADLRKGSPTFGVWTGITLSSETGHQLYIPEGFAHGFMVVSDEAVVHYKCTDYYSPLDERGILWSDPDLAIDWPGGTAIVSPRDAAFPALRDISGEDLPDFIR